MKRFWRRVLSGGLWVAVLSLLLCHGAWARTVLIWNSDSSCDPARHALQHLVKTLEEKGSSVTVVADRATAKERSGRGVIEIRTPDAELTSEWEKPESYRIQVEAGTPRKHIVITGSDAVGLMYGIFEIAEQVAMTTFNGDSLWAALHEASGTPALEIRADNPFLTLEKDRSISPWFYDEGFWREYFDTLARNRFNLCDIHAMYVFEDTSFPNLIPYFLRNHERPGTSMPNESLERNLAMLNRIIDLGEERGVHVALMNYSMDFPGIDPGDEATQVEHTRWAVAELLKRCPRLWMFGFRIGESGKSEGFFERSFLEGIRSSGKEDVRLYTRTWGAEFKDLAQIGMAYPENFYIEIKYNGEHLGAPYHAIQGGGASYSYQTYLKYPRYWKIIWQIRANGTHRLFPWYDPAFTRRCVQSSAFGDAIGFTLEPHTAYYTQDSSLVLREREDANLFPYVFERHWAWYMSWGRLAYNPETPDAVFDKAFERRFGKEAGQRVADVLTVASRIVPLIYRHHCLGPDHRNMAPEFETGNNSNYNAGQSIVQDIDSFAQVGGLDGQTHISPAAYVKDYLKRELAGKVSPLEAAERLEALASQCVEWLDDTEVTEGHREWALLSNDVRALASLARYYVEKDRAACALQFYYETHDASQAIAAKKHVLEAREQWRRLDEVASRQYRSILDRLRMGWEFTWGKMLPDLDADLARVEAVITEIEQEESPRSGHVPVFQATSGEALELSVGVAGLKDPAVVRTLELSRYDSR